MIVDKALGRIAQVLLLKIDIVSLSLHLPKAAYFFPHQKFLYIISSSKTCKVTWYVPQAVLVKFKLKLDLTKAFAIFC